MMTSHGNSRTFSPPKTDRVRAFQIMVTQLREYLRNNLALVEERGFLHAAASVTVEFYSTLFWDLKKKNFKKC